MSSHATARKEKPTWQRKLLKPKGEIWRRGWDSNQRWLLKTKNLTGFTFRTIRQIRRKACVETRIEHVALTVLKAPVRRLSDIAPSRDLAIPRELPVAVVKAVEVQCGH